MCETQNETQKRKKMRLKDEQGQALLFVVVAMTIALAVGVNASLRTLSSISRGSSTDTASRVGAAAEGGLERFLTKTVGEMRGTGSGDGLVDLCSDYDIAITHSDDCIVEFDPLPNDNITARAVITVEEYGAEETELYFDLAVRGNVKEVNLDDASDPVDSVRVCWNGDDTDLYFSVYGYSDASPPEALHESGVLCGPSCVSGSVEGALNGSGSSSGCGDDGTYDTRITIPSAYFGDVVNAVGLRLVPLHADTHIFVRILDSGTAGFPVQGYTITSVGELAGPSGITATKTLSVMRSLPYLPAVFDFGVFSGGNLE